STDAYPATMSIDGAALPIALSARGNSRRMDDRCRFPPLRVALQSDAPDGHVMADQKRLKLVTHCRDSDRIEQLALREYAAYRLYRAMTPESLAVRLARITYVDDGSGKPVTTRYGFFIEDADDAAERLGRKDIDVPAIDVASLDRAAAGRFAAFQYMISNVDWSLLASAGDKDCCHNVKLARADGGGPVLPLPYDFDAAGIVDAPYAFAPQDLGGNDVRQRHYRGLCLHNSDARAAVAALRPRRAELLRIATDIPGMDERSRDKTRKFLDKFFEDIKTDEVMERRMFSDCRS
ncbi:MAG: hypothetical protein AAGD40_06215, partial [Pseudomonadota bacterium]